MNNKPNLKPAFPSTMVFICDLNANDVFVMPGQDTLYVCESRRTMDNMTTVVYRVWNDTSVRSTFTKVSLSTAYLLD